MPFEAPRPVPPDPVPSVVDVARYCGRPVSAKVEEAYAAELAAQVAACRTSPYGADLGEALKRRVMTNLARRALPLGTQPNGELGSTAVGTYDPEVRRLERPYRRLVVG